MVHSVSRVVLLLITAATEVTGFVPSALCHSSFRPSAQDDRSLLPGGAAGVCGGDGVAWARSTGGWVQVRPSALSAVKTGGDDDEEEEVEDKKVLEGRTTSRVMPFDKGASEFVPVDMQPANEWLNLKEEFLFDWPLLTEQGFATRLAGIFAFFAIIISYPIASDTYGAPDEATLRLLASSIGGLAVTLALTLRLLAGYSFVGSRLKSSVVYFETDERKPRSEMGLTRLGYERRGDMWIKPEEITRRDFLIWDFTVKPIVQRLQKACGGLAGGIAVSYLLFVAQGQAQGTAYDPRFLQSEQHLQELIVPANEMAANREAERLRERGNKPAYCYSRYYQAVAGGDACRD